MGLSRRRQEQVGAEVRAALGDFAAAVEVRLHAELDRSVRTQLALVKAVRGLREDIAHRDGEIARALDTLGKAIEHGADSVDSERIERRAMAEVERIERRTLAEAERIERRAMAEADRLERRALIEALAYLAQTLTEREAIARASIDDIDLITDAELAAGPESAAPNDPSHRNGSSDAPTPANGSEPVDEPPRRVWSRH